MKTNCSHIVCKIIHKRLWEGHCCGSEIGVKTALLFSCAWTISTFKYDLKYCSLLKSRAATNGDKCKQSKYAASKANIPSCGHNQGWFLDEGGSKGDQIKN